MNTEELRIYLRTVADTSGATQTQQALKGVQTQAAQSGRAASTTAANLGAGFSLSTQSILRFAGSIGLATSALQLAQQLIAGVGDTIARASEQFVISERVIRATSAAYGGMANDWVRFAERMGVATGFSRDAILQAALSARTLSQNYQLSIEQTRKLIQVSADLAQTRGIGIAESFERIQSAIRGEAEASEYLGLTLNDTFIKNNALNGSLKNTFETMSDVQKAQIRYGEVLRQTTQFSGLAASSADTLEGAQRRNARASEEFSRVLGGILAPALRDVASAQTSATEALTGWLRGFDRLPSSQELRNRAVELEKSLPVIGPQPVAPVDRQLIPLGRETQSGIEALNTSLQRLGISVQKNLVYLWRIAPEGPLQVDAAIRRLMADMELFGQRASDLGTILQALPIGDTLARAAIQAEQSMQRIDQAVTARLAAAQRIARARELEQGASRIFDPRDAPGRDAALARLALLDQLEAAHRDLITAQDAQTNLQRESVQLAAQEAAIKLQMLPAQQRLAALQRDITEQQARARLAALPATEALEDLQYHQQRVRLIEQGHTLLMEEQLRSRLAGLPASEALDDLRYAQQKAQLTLQDRQASAAERAAARRELRDLGRTEPGLERAALEAAHQLTLLERAGARAGLEQQLRDLPAQRELAAAELAVLEARQAGVPVERAATRLGLEQQLLDIATQRALAPIEAAQQANQLVQAIVEPIVQAQQALIQQIIDQGRGPLNLNLTITLPNGSVVSYAELVEANAQAAIPPVVLQSGVRRH